MPVGSLGHSGSLSLPGHFGPGLPSLYLVVASVSAVISFLSHLSPSGTVPSARQVTSVTRLPGRRFGLHVSLCSQSRFSKCRSLLAPAVFLPARGDPGAAAPPAAYDGPRRECPPPPTPPPPPGTREPEQAAHALTVTTALLIGCASRRHGEDPGGSWKPEPARAQTEPAERRGRWLAASPASAILLLWLLGTG